MTEEVIKNKRTNSRTDKRMNVTENQSTYVYTSVNECTHALSLRPFPYIEGKRDRIRNQVIRLPTYKACLRMNSPTETTFMFVRFSDGFD